MNAPKPNSKAMSYSYDVCLSFAGEDREYVRTVARRLQQAGAFVFFDEFQATNLWGKDLYEHLDYIYSKAARYCVVFCSESYRRKLWTNHERKSALARAFEENTEYILPARFDETEIPGIRKTIGYLDLRRIKPTELAVEVMKKIVPSKLIEARDRENYLPTVLDVLYKKLGAEDAGAQEAVQEPSHSFFRSLSLMNKEERFALYPIFLAGCMRDLPRNMHIEFDLLRRITGWTQVRIKNRLKALDSVGFKITMPSEKTTKGLVSVEWHCRKVGYGNCTEIANAMIHVVADNYCFEHCMEMLIKLNFSALSTETAVPCGHAPSRLGEPTTEESGCHSSK